MSAYARQAVARSSSGWTVSGNDASLFATISFPACASGTAAVTHFGVGTASTLVAGHLLFFGTVTPNIAVAAGITPKLDTGTKVSQASSDGMSNEAATNFLLLMFNNTAWAAIGDSSGLQPSGGAGSLYLSLHTASPGEGGDQTTNEATYS